MKGTIKVDGMEVPPEIYFENVAGYKLIHEDKYIKVYDLFR